MRLIPGLVFVLLVDDSVCSRFLAVTGIRAAMLSSDLPDDGVPATMKVKKSLRRSRTEYQAFLIKQYREMEFYFSTNRTSNYLATSLKTFMQHS